jgi:hypothetical protein
MTISIANTKSMPVKGKEILFSKIVLDNRITEQDKTFKYLGNTISVKGKHYLETRINSCDK